MAGFNITRIQLVEDGSEWVIRPMTRYHADRLYEMVGE